MLQCHQFLMMLKVRNWYPVTLNYHLCHKSFHLLLQFLASVSKLKPIKDNTTTKTENKSLSLHSKSTWRPKPLWILCSVPVSVSSVCLSVLSVSLSFVTYFAGSTTLQHLGLVDILGLNPNPQNPNL